MAHDARRIQEEAAGYAHSRLSGTSCEPVSGQTARPACTRPAPDGSTRQTQPTGAHCTDMGPTFQSGQASCRKHLSSYIILRLHVFGYNETGQRVNKN